MKRKHVRTRRSVVAFDGHDIGRYNLKPGFYRLNGRDFSVDPPYFRYVGAFIVHPDQTVEFYGHDMLIEPKEDLANEK